MSRTVNVTEIEQPITFFNKRGEEVVAGNISIHSYEGERLQRHYFKPSTTNPLAIKRDLQNPRGYSLGFGSSGSKFINPADAQRALIEQGYTIKDVYGVNGGAQLITILSRDDITFHDMIDYDIEMWGTHAATNYLHPAVHLETSLFLGSMGERIREGLFRDICTNGLMSSVMELPEIKIRHDDWSIEKMYELLQAHNFSVYDEMPTGPQITTSNTLQRVYSLLSQYRDQLEAGKGLSEGFRKLGDMFKMLRPETMQFWMLSRYIDQLGVMISGRSGGSSTPIYAINMVNAYTSAVNQHRLTHPSDRGVYSAMDTMDTILKNTETLGNLAEIFSSISTFAVPDIPLMYDGPEPVAIEPTIEQANEGESEWSLEPREYVPGPKHDLSNVKPAFDIPEEDEDPEEVEGEISDDETADEFAAYLSKKL